MNPVTKALSRLTLHRPVIRLWLRKGRARLRDPLGRGLFANIAGEAVRVPAFFANGAWTSFETAPLDKFRKWLRDNPEPLFFDIGCSVGIYSLTALAVNSSARVWSIDPDWVGLKATRHLCRHVGPHRLTSLYGFIGDRHLSGRGLEEAAADTVRFLSEKPAGWESESLTFFSLSEGLGKIPAHSFDGLMEHDPHAGVLPCCLKIDVEGAELEVLRGSSRFLDRRRPAILLSVHPDKLGSFGASVGDVRAFIEARAYKAEVLSVDHEEHWWCLPSDTGPVR